MTDHQPFAARTVAWIIAAGFIAFAAFFVLASYAPDFRSSPPGAAVADGKAGNGYAGLVELLRLSGEEVDLVRHVWSDENLVVIPLDETMELDRITDMAAERTYWPTLYILPKWTVAPLPTNPRFVQKTGMMPLKTRQAMRAAIDRGLPRYDGAEDAVVEEGFAPGSLTPPDSALTHLGHGSNWLLADADLLNNAGLADAATAARAVALIRGINEGDAPIVFDLSLARAPTSPSLAKLVLEPPFLALTLCLVIAALFAYLSGVARFGPALVRERALRFGKTALADATARLMRRGGRIGRLGERYGEALKQRAATRLHAPAGMSGDALIHWLDMRDGKDARSFSDRLSHLQNATNEHDMIDAGRDLHRWIEGKIRED